MNYEELYLELKAQEKEIAGTIKDLQKCMKSIGKTIENGDLREMRKSLEELQGLCAAQADQAVKLRESAVSFDTEEYFRSGDFARQLVEDAGARGVDITGDYPVYEMFPYRVRIDEENQDIYLNRKKYQSARPSYFVQTVQAEQEKLKKVRFNADTFAAELAEAYDLAVLKGGSKKKDPDLMLTRVYRFMVPMSRSRKEYDSQAFAYDIARLYEAGMEDFRTKDGRRIQFGTSRNNGNAIRILDAEGREQFIATVRFISE